MAEKPVLYAWSATRSGASMTVTAKDARGVQRRIAGVVTIAPAEGEIVATTRDGKQFQLATAEAAAA